MKTVLLTPSSVNPKTQISADIKSEERSESCYFPKCRKDANCNCDMCLASINATLDLMPMSAQRSTLTKLSASKPSLETTPVSIDPTLLSTPASTTPPPPAHAPAPAPVPAPVVVVDADPLRSTAKSSNNNNNNQRKIDVKKRNLRIGGKLWRWVLFLGFVFAVEFGFSCWVRRVLRPALSEEMIKDVFKASSGGSELSERLDLVQKQLVGVLGDQVSRCNLGDSSWKIDQDGLITHSYCILYQSAAEEMVARGWPLQATGLLTAGFSSRSFAILSGRLTEWPEGNMVYEVRDKNSTWILQKWGASFVKFEANTWIIEYKKSMFFEDPSILLASVKFLKFTIRKLVGRMRQHLWLLPDLRYYAAYISEERSSFPT